MIASILSYIVSIGITFIISKLGQHLVWHNKKKDGTPKSPWAPSPQHLSWFSGGYKEFEQDSYHALTRWSKELGDLFSVRLGFKRILVLNSADLVHKMLIEKEQLNSSRVIPSDTFEKLQTDQCKTVFLAPFDKYWSRIRRATYLVVGKMNAPRQFSKLFKEQAKKLTSGIGLEDGKLTAKRLRQLVDMMAMDSALTMVMGSYKNERDPVAMMTLIQKCHGLEERQTRKCNRMGQFFPVINGWLDVKSLFTLDSRNLDLRNQILGVVLPWFEHIYKSKGNVHVPLGQQAQWWSSSTTSNGGQLDSITKSLLNIAPSKNDPEPAQLSKDEILVNSVHMTMHAYTYLASALFTLIQRLAHEPDELQERLKQETTSQDKRLAYAFVNESLRYDTPNRILSYGPRTDYDLEFNGSLYRVDADTEIVVNVHAIHNDSRYYSKPQHFNPDRFMQQTPEMMSPLLTNDTKHASDHLAFGAGRRACIASKASQDFLVATLIQLVKQYKLVGGDVKDKIESTTSIWSWTGRTETKGSSIEFIER